MDRQREELAQAKDKPRLQPSKTVRLGNVEELLRTRQVRSQKELQELLAERGIWATQATLSRDLLELGATKQRKANGNSAYSLTDWEQQNLPSTDADAEHPHLAKWAQDLLMSSAVAGNMIVLRTGAAGAQLLALGVDQARIETVLGCIAGENTVFVVCSSEAAAQALHERFMEYIYR